MRVRCPKGNHFFDLADDTVGARVRCPLCSHLFFVEAALCEGEPPSEQIKPTAPAPPIPRDEMELSHRLYDGLPPLSVMIAMRRQQGRHQEADDLAAKLEMTPDDWKALDAYECVLTAAYSLRTSVMVAGFAVLLQLPRLALSSGEESQRLEIYTVLAIAAIAGCLGLLWIGSVSLQHVHQTTLVRQLTIVILVAGVLFALLAIANIIKFPHLRSSDSGPFWTILSIPFAFISLFDLGRSGVRTHRALEQTRPPEITNRLTDALKYLE
jgi:hypothetical protein